MTAENLIIGGNETYSKMQTACPKTSHKHVNFPMVFHLWEVYIIPLFRNVSVAVL